VVSELFRWGTQILGNPRHDDTVRASWLIGAIEATAEADGLSAEIDESYEFRVGDEVVTVVVSRGTIDARQGPAESPALVIQTDHETFASLGTQRISPEDAIREGKLFVEGDPDAAARCSKLFGLLDSEVATSA
jgi:hypothetical protein